MIAEIAIQWMLVWFDPSTLRPIGGEPYRWQTEEECHRWKEEHISSGIATVLAVCVSDDPGPHVADLVARG